MKTHSINALLISRITDYLNPYLRSLHEHSIQNDGSKIEIIGSTNGNSTSVFVLIEIVIKEEWKQIFIPKIYLPDSMKHQGIGKHLIKVIYGAAKSLGYELFIVQMTDSFYARMRKRGALKCEKPDEVQIVGSTKLD